MIVSDTLHPWSSSIALFMAFFLLLFAVHCWYKRKGREGRFRNLLVYGILLLNWASASLNLAPVTVDAGTEGVTRAVWSMAWKRCQYSVCIVPLHWI